MARTGAAITPEPTGAMGATPTPRRRAARCRAPRTAPLCALLLLVGAVASPPRAHAAAGSGTATITPPGAVVAGGTGSWTVTYIAAEDFANGGGYFEVDIPAGWTPPQRTNPTQAGYIGWTNPVVVDSVVISGMAVRVYLGTPPDKFL